MRSTFGIQLNTDENEVRRRLGRPDIEDVSGRGMLLGNPIIATRSLDYNALGLKLSLEKRKVILLSKVAPHDAGFWWWMTYGHVTSGFTS